MPRKIILIGVLVLILVTVFWPKPKHFLTLGTTRINVEIAQTEAEQERGLSGRADLPENHGLLFVYTQDARPAFWMKEMNFPIDIIWLDKNLTVVGIERNISPDTYPQTFSSPAPIRYGLEVRAGFVDKYHLKVGDKAYN